MEIMLRRIQGRHDGRIRNFNAFQWLDFEGQVAQEPAEWGRHFLYVIE